MPIESFQYFHHHHIQCCDDENIAGAISGSDVS